MWTKYLRMAGRLDEVQARMYSVINDLLTVDAIFLLQVRVKA